MKQGSHDDQIPEKAGKAPVFRVFAAGSEDALPTGPHEAASQMSDSALTGIVGGAFPTAVNSQITDIRTDLR